YEVVKTPIVTGYVADQASVTGEDKPVNQTYTVTYTKLGKIIPNDENGQPIPKAPTPTYNNDPKDPTKGGETPVPNIPGYHSEVPTVTPDPHNPGKDTPVKYVKDDAKATVTFIDDKTQQTLTTTTLAGKAGEVIDFTNAQGQLTKYENDGYVVVSNEIPTAETKYDTTKDDGAMPSQTYVVHLNHGEETVTPDNPHHPGDPI
ncbi:mucin-binding protein, partial [Limosilactobacillus equigenerosi]|uniref:mucin-binding protein n=1 Tax=Limosilactobacillus equigenerosi TaxID=417373 RepID=UPI000A97CEF7